MSIRSIKRITQANPTIEGAGVRLHRAFGFGDTASHDPFLLLDDFRNDNPTDYLPGFPWHPHRGIETVTYMLAGEVEHGDSLGNVGTLGPGDVQWMTAGNGILHQEMPRGDETGRMYGFQLWVNLPASLKMTKPRYQDIASNDIPEVTDADGTRIRIICGRYRGISGPVDGIAAEPQYLDIDLPPASEITLPMPAYRNAFAYVFEGVGDFLNESPAQDDRGEDALAGSASPAPSEVGNRSLVLFDDGDEVKVTASKDGLRFLLISGKPLREPVAWRGPIVMNTQEQLRQAFDEIHKGTFIKNAD